jgi:hypothetical protein
VCGPDNLTTEHLRFAHPSLVMHLKFLFQLVLQYGFVPDSFGDGFIIL